MVGARGVLRKALFSRGVPSRLVAVRGLLYMIVQQLRDMEDNGEDDSLLAEPEMSLSQVCCRISIDLVRGVNWVVQMRTIATTSWDQCSTLTAHILAYTVLSLSPFSCRLSSKCACSQHLCHVRLQPAAGTERNRIAYCAASAKCASCCNCTSIQ